MSTLLRAGKDVSVTTADGSAETVTVRELPVRKLSDWLAAQDDEVGMVKLVTGKDEAWVDSLDRASFLAVVDAATELNQAFFGDLVRRRLDRTEALMPGFAEKVQAAATSRSPSSSGGSGTSPQPAG